MLNGKWSQGSVGDVTITWGLAGGQLLHLNPTVSEITTKFSVVGPGARHLAAPAKKLVSFESFITEWKCQLCLQSRWSIL